MATLTRKPASPPSGATRRPALRAQAESAQASPAVPSTCSPSEDTAAYAIGYAAGLAEGQKLGAERERHALYSKESIDELIERSMALEVRPRALRALDRVVSWLLYAIGVSGIGMALVIMWRLSKWI